MATIDDLNKSISDMPTEEIYNLLRNIRASRRQKKQVGRAPYTRRSKTSVETLLGGLTPEQRRQLLGILE